MDDRKTALLVEDEHTVRMVLAAVIQDLGYDVIEASDGRAALAVLRANTHIELMVADIGLPDLSGRRLAEIVRQRKPAVKIVLMTGYEPDAPPAASVPMLMKPFGADALEAVILALADHDPTSP